MLILLSLGLCLSSAYAVKVSPVRYDLSIAKGSSKEFTLNLTGSKGSYNQNLTIYPSDLFMNRTGALSFDVIKDSKNSAVDWIKMSKSQVSLLEDQSVALKFIVSIPSTAAPGEYYAVIMVEPREFTKVKDKKQPVMLQMKSRVAVVVVLNVPGRTYEKKGEASEIKIIETDSLVRLTSAFKNTGDIHLDVTSEATIRSSDGKISFGTCKLKALSSSKDEAFVFPGATRDFEGSLKRQLPSGDYIAEVSYNYGYDFRKAKQSVKFSVKRDKPLNEKDAEFLRLNSKEIRLFIPKGGRRSQIIELTNIDYKPLNVTMTSAGWVGIVQSNLTLKPGEVRKIMINISSVDPNQPLNKEAILSFKTDRGKSVEIKIFVSGQNLTKDTGSNNKKVLNK